MEAQNLRQIFVQFRARMICTLHGVISLTKNIVMYRQWCILLFPCAILVPLYRVRSSRDGKAPEVANATGPGIARERHRQLRKPHPVDSIESRNLGQ